MGKNPNLNQPFSKLAVIGSGVMGAGLAAHFANARFDQKSGKKAETSVLLLDLADDQTDPSRRAKEAVQKLKKSNPAALTHPGRAKAIHCGNLDDDLERLRDCDLVLEAVVERADIKRDLYKKLSPYLKPTAFLASNTSTLPLKDLIDGMDSNLASRFLITHFFNPPRYMPLVEVVTGPDFDQKNAAVLFDFLDRCLGKTIVQCKDSPGFIANRLGVYWVQTAINFARSEGLSVEEADAILSRPSGLPKTGVFGLADLVGLDLMPAIEAALGQHLPADDPLLLEKQSFPVFEKMLAEGYTGRKGKGGFYRLEGKEKRKQAIDLETGIYRDQVKSTLASAKLRNEKFADLLAHPDKGGRYARKVWLSTLAYARQIAPQAAYRTDDVDAAMRLGYNWKRGPFELIDLIGAETFDKLLESEGMAPPSKPEQNRASSSSRPVTWPTNTPLQLSAIKAASTPVIKNVSASLWDIGDGVACFEFTSKMNTFDQDTFQALTKSLRKVKSDFQALVIYNDSKNFSVGANLGLASFAANIAAFAEIENIISTGQSCFAAMKAAPFPVVGAPSGMALGGGCEILLHCDAIQAHVESYIGLVEAGVGIIPGWGGCKEMLLRWAQGSPAKGPMPGPSKVFELVSIAHVAKSADEAAVNLFLRPHDRVTMNRARLLEDAKALACSLVKNYRPPEPQSLHLPGPAGRLAFKLAAESFFRLGKASRYDLKVADALGRVLSGGETDGVRSLSEQEILDLEREEIVKLFREPKTLERMAYTLETGKPLRN